MFIQQKDESTGRISVILDGTLIRTPYIGEFENMKRYAKFVVKFGSYHDGNEFKPRLMNCVTMMPLAIDLCETLNKDELVVCLGQRIKDNYPDIKEDNRQYCINCSAIIPVKRMYRSIIWGIESMQYEKKIYKDVIDKSHSGITYDGEPDEILDLDF